MLVSENLLHVFQRCQDNEGLVVVVVCRVAANLGMGLAKSRMALAKVEATAN